MTSARTIKGSLAIALLALGCGSEAPKTAPDDSFEGLAGFEEKADQFSTKMTLVGSLNYGQTSAAVRYHNPPLYRAFKFAGAKGDAVKIDVTSANGDSVAWLVDNSFKILATNDDANSNTLDSHIDATLPGNTNASIVTYYIIFREYSKADATFNVKLTGPAACVQRVFCMQGSHFDTTQCKCVTDAQFCGGIAGIRCPAGQKCIDNPNDSCDPNNGGADCGGICVQCVQNVLCTTTSHWDAASCACVPNVAHCGGIAGIACPSGQRCVDDPSDSCDPAHGGADCGGICVAQCVQTVACTTTSHWDSTACRCVANTCVQNVLCTTTSHWDSTSCSCVPNTPPAPSCDGVRCTTGNTCSICRTTSGPAPVCLPTGAVC